ncbi:hypothetical protein HW115_02300 [Verrucomicrobiaceae bacterium N1E253]|uniref:Uncharacterized protein n=1 Tax=Oceaniferula marina TaxID=2748318 RepID=A0A851GGQ0_9BACT|nr:hypothetical protein [Oceaniferula marina]NWK54425.1 hypothetical protein [Oceaniferula marina]
MKHSSIILLAIASLSTVALANQSPTGQLTVDKSMVRKGGIPTLTWNIFHPIKQIEEVVDIDDNDEITAKKRLRVQVSVIGIGITDGRNEYKSTSWLHFSSSGWKHVFEGYGSQVNTSQINIDRILEPGEKIKFAARYYWNSWQPYYYSNGDNVKALINGDQPPSKAGGYDQSSLNDYLRPYVKDGKLNLGELDIIYAAELTHTDQRASGFDMQDTIILLRFSEVE